MCSWRSLPTLAPTSRCGTPSALHQGTSAFVCLACLCQRAPVRPCRRRRRRSVQPNHTTRSMCAGPALRTPAAQVRRSTGAPAPHSQAREAQPIGHLLRWRVRRALLAHVPLLCVLPGPTAAAAQPRAAPTRRHTCGGARRSAALGVLDRGGPRVLVHALAAGRGGRRARGRGCACAWRRAPAGSADMARRHCAATQRRDLAKCCDGAYGVLSKAAGGHADDRRHCGFSGGCVGHSIWRSVQPALRHEATAARHARHQTARDIRGAGRRGLSAQCGCKRGCRHACESGLWRRFASGTASPAQTLAAAHARAHAGGQPQSLSAFASTSAPRRAYTRGMSIHAATAVTAHSTKLAVLRHEVRPCRSQIRQAAQLQVQTVMISSCKQGQ